MQRICLSMIVKDEAAVIGRCLRSVRPFIDAWVIVDTGSTDGTEERIREALAGIPGELHRRPWVDFATNRTEALRLAGQRSDYVYGIDADEELQVGEGWRWPVLREDAYSLRYSFENLVYDRIALVASRLPWRYEGVLHEYLECDHPVKAAPLSGAVVVSRPEGARSRDPDKFRKDALVLEEALRKDGSNTRYRFYLAQSHRDAGDLEKALENYRIRAAQGGWEEEVYVSRLNIARLTERRGAGPVEVAQRYLEAHASRPSRAEALVGLARFHRLRDEHAQAYAYARTATQLRPCADVLFVETDALSWRAYDERAVAAHWTGRYEESLRLCDALLSEGRLPETERERVERNRQFTLAALGAAPR